jgi:hypothetical protein
MKGAKRRRRSIASNRFRARQTRLGIRRFGTSIGEPGLHFNTSGALGKDQRMRSGRRGPPPGPRNVSQPHRGRRIPDRVVVGCGQVGENRGPPMTREGDGLTLWCWSSPRVRSRRPPYSPWHYLRYRGHQGEAMSSPSAYLDAQRELRNEFPSFEGVSRRRDRRARTIAAASKHRRWS